MRTRTRFRRDHCPPAYLFGWALAAAGVSGLLALRGREWFDW